MISSLLTALGVAALSIQTPSNIQPQEPKRAYYDSSAVANYGTTQNALYNYTSYYMGAGETDGSVGDEDEYYISYGNYETVTGFNLTYIELSDYQLIDIYFCSSIPSNGAVEDMNPNWRFDLYVNGVFAVTLEPSLTLESNVYSFRIPSTLFSQGSYGWLFDHQEQSMSETIAEVVGDATTAAGAVLGSGISGAIALFYNEGITGLGIIALILTGVSLVWFAFSLILRLWRRR